MTLRTSTRPVLLGTLAGMGLGAGALALWRPAAAERAPCRTEACATQRLVHAVEQGLPEQGSLEIRDLMSVRRREFARDPSDASVLQVRFPERPQSLLVAPATDVLSQVIGSFERFKEAYRLARDPEVVPMGTESAFLQEYRKLGCDGCVIRRIWIGSESLRILKVEDRTSDGRVFLTLNISSGPLAGWHPKAGLPVAVRPWKSGSSGRDATADFLEFVSKIPFPVYEPGELPPKFERSGYGFDSTPPRRGEPELPIVWIAYTDGVVRMNLFVTEPAQMRRLEALARRNDGTPSAGTCPSLETTPEEILEDGPGTVLVRRRNNGCRTVLERDDLEGVVVALVGYPGLRPDDYVRTIRHLVPVGPQAKPGERVLSPIK